MPTWFDYDDDKVYTDYLYSTYGYVPDWDYESVRNEIYNESHMH